MLNKDIMNAAVAKAAGKEPPKVQVTPPDGAATITIEQKLREFSAILADETKKSTDQIKLAQEKAIAELSKLGKPDEAIMREFTAMKDGFNTISDALKSFKPENGDGLKDILERQLSAIKDEMTGLNNKMADLEGRIVKGE